MFLYLCISSMINASDSHNPLYTYTACFTSYTYFPLDILRCMSCPIQEAFKRSASVILVNRNRSWHVYHILKVDTGQLRLPCTHVLKQRADGVVSRPARGPFLARVCEKGHKGRKGQGEGIKACNGGKGWAKNAER